MRPAILIGAMALMTILTRFLPFLIFRRQVPAYVTYLGRVLPPAAIGLLVIYCLRDVSFGAVSGWLPALLSVLCVAGLQAWKRSSLLSILGGTAIYMVLIRVM